MLKANFVEGLIKCLPQDDQIKKLQKLRNGNVALNKVEIFFAGLCDINCLVPRLHRIKFLINFNDMIKDVEIDISAATIACEEVLSCKRFHKIVRLILSIGNILNAGTNIGGAVAFELPALTNLDDVKSSENQRTLLSFIVETVQRKIPKM